MTEGKRRRRRPRRRQNRNGGEVGAGEPASSAQGATPVSARTAEKESKPAGSNGRGRTPSKGVVRRPPERLAALDLGTNNCRLLIAAPRGRSLRIVDAFSRIVRLGEGLSQTGALSDAAMERAIEALAVCAEKIERRDVTRRRCIATQACRAASNGAEFLDRVKTRTGLEFEVISTEEEARLAVRGSAELLDSSSSACLVFDIGGGSTEMSWIRPRADAEPEIVAWLSLPVGVVNLSEKWGGRDVTPDTYEDIVESVTAELRHFGDPAGLRGLFQSDSAHLLGTSGTVTSIAGVHLGLTRYRRELVDGLWLSRDETRAVTDRLIAMDFAARAEEPCIGVERADLVVCGCAILEALLREWPATRIRVGDRGLREGILADLADRARRSGRRRRDRPH